MSKRPPPPDESADFDVGFEGVRRRQLRQGLALSYAERLAWLERKNAELKALLGKARTAEQVGRVKRGS